MYDAGYGVGEIIKLNYYYDFGGYREKAIYPIVVKFNNPELYKFEDIIKQYTIDGKKYPNDKKPSLASIKYQFT